MREPSVVWVMPGAGIRWGSRPHARRLPRPLARPARAALGAGALVLLTDCPDYGMSVPEYSVLDEIMPGFADLTRRTRVATMGADGRLYARAVHAYLLTYAEPWLRQREARAIAAAITAARCANRTKEAPMQHTLDLDEVKRVGARLYQWVSPLVEDASLCILYSDDDHPGIKRVFLSLIPRDGARRSLHAKVSRLVGAPGTAHAALPGLVVFAGTYDGMPLTVLVHTELA
jgi:hypothetical protein